MNGYPALGIALLLAVSDWLVVARHKQRADFILKPATQAAILVAAWLFTLGPHDAWQARFFLLGLALSLVGDVLLMFSGSRYFMLGGVAFALAHLCYIAGLNPTLPPWPAPLLLLPIAGLNGWYLRNFKSRCTHSAGALTPLLLYALVLSLMLFSAGSTLFRPEWTALRRGKVIAGASLFFASDAMLAWRCFVAPSDTLHVLVRVTYHLGQLALAASICRGLT